MASPDSLVQRLQQLAGIDRLQRNIVPQLETGNKIEQSLPGPGVAAAMVFRLQCPALISVRDVLAA